MKIDAERGLLLESVSSDKVENTGIGGLPDSVFRLNREFMRIIKGFFAVLAVALAIGVADLRAQTNSGLINRRTADKVRILSVTAANPIVDGVENDFTVEIRYTLGSMEEATLSIGFNADDLNRYRMTTRKKIRKGSGTIKLQAILIPTDWRGRGDFTAMANIAPYPLPQARYRPITSTTQVVDFEK